MAYPNINKTYAQTKYNVTKKAGRKVLYIVDHYTGTDAPAANNCKYFGGGNRNASADFFIDKDGTIYQFNADIANYYTWHSGDGKGKYGITNANSIGIEVVSSGSDYTQAQKDALRALTAALMADYGVPASNVVRHYDASRKTCPAPYCGSAAKDAKWKELHAYITGATKGSSAPSEAKASDGYVVRIKANVLNVRDGAGTNYRVNATVKKGEAYTIVSEKMNGSTKWGELKSGVGWISLAYTEKVTAQAKPTKSVDEIAREVIDGKWGNGSDRKARLIAAGYDYNAVQKRVNQLLK